MKLIRLVPALAAVTALAGLAACSPGPTVAAQVGDATITSALVDKSFTSCQDLGVQAPVATILTVLVYGEVAQGLASEYGLPLENSVLDQFVPAEALASDGCDDVFRAEASVNLIASELGEEIVLDALGNADVEVNPRFGAWDPQALGVAGSGSLSVPASN